MLHKCALTRAHFVMTVSKGSCMGCSLALLVPRGWTLEVTRDENYRQWELLCKRSRNAMAEDA